MLKISSAEIKKLWFYDFTKRNVGTCRDREEYIRWTLSPPVNKMIRKNIERSGVHITDEDFEALMRRIVELVCLDNNDILFYTEENNNTRELQHIQFPVRK